MDAFIFEGREEKRLVLRIQWRTERTENREDGNICLESIYIERRGEERSIYTERRR